MKNRADLGFFFLLSDLNLQFSNTRTQQQICFMLDQLLTLHRWGNNNGISSWYQISLIIWDSLFILIHFSWEKIFLYCQQEPIFTRVQFSVVYLLHLGSLKDVFLSFWL